MNKKYNESGQVAIVTVVMFILLFSVLVVSFTRIMATQSRQTVNDELSARALAAAESGIEDAKRILVYCNGKIKDPMYPECSLFSNPNRVRELGCYGITGNPELLGTRLKVDTNGQTDAEKRQIKVGNNEEYYLCLKIDPYVDNYTSTLSENGKSEIVPLRFVDGNGNRVAAATVFIEWHYIREEKSVSGVLPKSDLPSYKTWRDTNVNRPAAIRLELTSFQPWGSIEALTNNSRAVTMRPSSDHDAVDFFNDCSTGYLLYASSCSNISTAPAPSADVNWAYNIDRWAPDVIPNQVNQVNATTTYPKTPLLQRFCNHGTGYDYACYMRITNSARNFGDWNSKQSYLRLQSIYNDTNFRITAKDVNGNNLYFDGVQAQVDVTGRAVDSYKRIESKLVLKNSNTDDALYGWWPEYAIDSGGQICKDIKVRSSAGTDGCPH